MAYRRAGNLLPRGRSYACILWKTQFKKGLNVNSRMDEFHEYLKNQSARTLHTGLSMMVAKLLSVDELFAKRSLQGYLKKMEVEYRECLKAVDGTEEGCTEGELRVKRTRVSLLAPLIRSIRELETKQKEMAETETLLEGEVQSMSWQGRAFYKPKKIMLIQNSAILQKICLTLFFYPPRWRSSPVWTCRDRKRKLCERYPRS